MLLISYDLYDIYAILCVIRLYPMAIENEKIVQALLDIIKAKQTDNCIMDNTVRRALASMKLNDEHWEWIKTFNTYSYGGRIIKDKGVYTSVVWEKLFESYAGLDYYYGALLIQIHIAFMIQKKKLWLKVRDS